LPKSFAIRETIVETGFGRIQKNIFPFRLASFSRPEKSWMTMLYAIELLAVKEKSFNKHTWFNAQKYCCTYQI
jgi:hypothetical protein